MRASVKTNFSFFYPTMAMCPYRMTVGDLLPVTEIKMKPWHPSAKPGQCQSLWNYQGLPLYVSH